MRQAAEYLGCSFWTARDYILQGLIPVVDMPPLRPREGDRQRKTLRRVLVDKPDLDALSNLESVATAVKWAERKPSARPPLIVESSFVPPPARRREARVELATPIPYNL